MDDNEKLPADEELVRALTLPKWDPVHDRITASAFCDDTGCSVSRTAILAYDELKKIFYSDLHKPPQTSLVGTVSVKVGAVRTACAALAQNSCIVDTIPDPIKDEPGSTDNPAHAEIRHFSPHERRKITRGMSKAIIDVADAPIKF